MLSTANLNDDSTIIYAPFPFDDQDADLILRTSDRVHYRIHSLLLSILSPVFKGMVTLPTVTTDNLQEKVDDRPCVQVDDESESLYQLLAWCDPRAIPAPTSLKDYQLALKLADKYGMDRISKRVVSTLEGPSGRAIVQANSFRVYATAIHYGFTPLAELAARELVLRVPLDERVMVPELKIISAPALQHLHEYHFSCVRAALTFTQKEKWTSSEWPEMVSFSKGGCCSKPYFAEHMDRLIHKLYNYPVGAVVLDSESLKMARSKMEACGSCRSAQKQRDFQSLLESLAQKIDHATSQVQLNFD